MRDSFGKLVLVAVLLIGSFPLPSLCGDLLDEKDTNSLKQLASQYANCEVKFIRKHANGERIVDGVFRARNGESVITYQYFDDPVLVTIRRDGSLVRLGQSEKSNGLWRPLRAKPDKTPLLKPSDAKADGPDFIFWGFSYVGNPIWKFSDQNSVSGFKVIEKRELDSNRVQISISREDNGNTSRFLLERDGLLRCTEYEWTNGSSTILNKLNYSIIDGNPHLSKIVYFKNGQETETMDFEWVSTKAADQKYFKLSHYGLSENLLNPVDANPTSSQSMYTVLFCMSGAFLFFLAWIVSRRR